MTTLAVVLWCLVTVLPGVATLRIIGLRDGFGWLIAMAAPIGIGYIYVVGLLASRIAAPVLGVDLIATATLLLGWILVEVRRRTTPVRRRRGVVVAGAAHHPVPARSLRASLNRLRQTPTLMCSRGLLIVAVGTGIVLWQTLHQDLSAPAGWDAMHHGFFVRQIVDHDTLRASVVLSSDSGQADGTTSFYPLSMNLITALLHISTGIKISVLIMASSTALAGILLPVGTYCLALRVLPRQPLVAGFAALASVLPADLFTIEFTGRVSAILGLALVPAGVLAIIGLYGRPNWRSSLATLLTVVGMIGIHTSELFMVLGLAATIMAAHACLGRLWVTFLRWAAWAAASAILGIVLLILVEPGIRNLVGERSGAFGAADGNGLTLRVALGQTVVLPYQFLVQNDRPMAVWSLLAAGGCVLAVRPTWNRLVGIAGCYVAFAVFYVAWLSSHVSGPFATLGEAWYDDSTRMLWVFLILGAIPIGAVLAVVATALTRMIRAALGWLSAVSAARRASPQPSVEPPASGRTAGPWVLTSTIAAVLVTVVTTLAYAAPPVKTDSRWLSTVASPVGPDYEAAFRYLSKHVGPQDRVLDDLRNHGDMWMYVDYNVPVLFGNAPLIGLAPDSWKQRLYLRAQLRHIGTDGCISQLLRQYHVTYVFFGTRYMGGGTPRITASILSDTRFFHRVFAAGAATVYQITLPRLHRPCTRNLTIQYPWDSLANAN